MKKFILQILRRILGTQGIMDFLADDMKKTEEKMDCILQMCGNYFPLLQIINLREYSRLLNSGFGELQILCDKYGSDKSSIFVKDAIHPYTWFSHTYANVYEILFAPIKNNVNYIFECGIGTNNINIPSNMGGGAMPGASLYVWNDYFRSSIVSIYGADIDRGVLFNDGKIRTYFMDQTKKSSVLEYFKNINGIKFDIMIDDGLHTSEAAITLFENSIQNLSENGIYFIEDMGINDVIDIYNYFSNKEFIVNYVTMPRGGYIDNNQNTLIIIKKK